RRDFSDRYAGHAILDSGGRTRIRARTHPRLRAAGQRDHAAFDRYADVLVHLARLFHRAWTVEPHLGRGLGMVFPQRPQGSPRHHRGRTGIVAAATVQFEAAGAMGTVAPPDVAGDPHLFLLWLVFMAVPELAAAVLQEQLQPGYPEF